MSETSLAQPAPAPLELSEFERILATRAFEYRLKREVFYPERVAIRSQGITLFFALEEIIKANLENGNSAPYSALLERVKAWLSCNNPLKQTVGQGRR